MKPVEFVNATTLHEAAELLRKHGKAARLVAGNTDLLGILKDRVHPEYPELLVNLKTVPGLNNIRSGEDGVTIGALTTIRVLETDPLIGAQYPLLTEAARALASPELRNTGTVGGNLCQEPRCWYYRYPDDYFHCTRKGGTNCNALTGENRFHSLFGSVPVVTRPCAGNCPGSIDIPSYMARLREGDPSSAARILVKNNPIPAITGRVCPHYCEENCNRNLHDEAVSIQEVERYLGDYLLDHAPEGFAVPPASGPSIAIVGAGPAGLSCAFYLRRAGHRVTVFEKMPEAGGMLRYAIPSYRLAPDTVSRQIAALEEMGIEFRFRVEIGRDISLEELQANYAAVFLAPGAWGQPQVGVQGEELLTTGLPFLTQVKDGLVEKPGEKVLVIGGGNVAVDVARTCVRLGCKEVRVVYRRTENEMPAYPWEVEEAIDEGVEFQFLTAPVGCEEVDGCVVGGLVCQQMELGEPDESGRCRPVATDAAPFVLAADSVISAVGQEPDLALIDRDGTLRSGHTWLQADNDTQATSVPGVFAGGDAVSGPSTVIAAIATGRKAAESITRYLGSESSMQPDPTPWRDLNRFNADFLGTVPRTASREHFREDLDLETENVQGLDWSQAEYEANRCFNCGCVAASPSDLAPALIALGASIRTTRRVVPAEEFFCAGPGRSTVLELGELVQEVQLPRLPDGARQAFRKFRIRGSIDFAIVNVAVVVKSESDKVVEARIVLGAVAPLPIRASVAESYLRGRKLSAETAAEAANLAVSECIPLGQNAYKVRVVQALVERALTGAV